MKDIKLLLVHI